MKTRWSENSKEILKELGGREPALLKVKICPKTMEMKVWVCLRKTKCSKIKTDLGIYEHLILKKRQHHRAERARWSFQEIMLKHPNWGKKKKKTLLHVQTHTKINADSKASISCFDRLSTRSLYPKCVHAFKTDKQKKNLIKMAQDMSRYFTKQSVNRANRSIKCS